MLKIETDQEAQQRIKGEPAPITPAFLPAAPQAGTVADIPDAELVRSAVISACRDRQPALRWAHVSEVFALGSTFAGQLCRRFGLDPDETVPAPGRQR